MKRCILIIACLFGPSVVLAETLQVDGVEYLTIQSAINDANHGDVIIVEPATYYETIDFLGKAVTVRSTDPNNPDIVENTVIDASLPDDPNIGSAATFISGEDANSVLEGFTIRNGTGQSDPTGASWYWKGTCGGGVFCRQSSPTIRKNIFTNCRVKYGGGAIYCHNQASPTITENAFLNNYARAYGGGVFARLKCSPFISNNLFKQNKCKTLGGAIYLADQSTSNIINNRIEENISSSLSGGAIYYFIKCSPIIANNIFLSNSSKVTGSCIMGSVTSTGLIINNVMMDNKLTQNTSYGAVLALYPNQTLASNIITNNDGHGMYGYENANIFIHNNNLWNNTLDNYSGTLSDQTGTNGNISEDPCFLPILPEVYVPFELQPDSACIDAGNNSYVPVWLTEDYDNSERIVNGQVDIGPQEYHALGVPQNFASIQTAIDAAQSGDTILISPGLYQENINFNGKNLVFRSIDPLDPCCVESTIIDGNDLDSCITLDSGEDKRSVIAGLTIQNGHGELYGGGIYIADYGGATILYNNFLSGYAGKYGGGIDTRHYTDTVIRNNYFENNYAYYAGGAIHLGSHASCEIYNNVMISNQGRLWGGAVYCYNNSYLEIVENEIFDNTAYYGGGIYAWRGNGLIARNHIWENYAITDGGGIAIIPYWQEPYTLVRIENNLVEANMCGESGGGIGLFRGIHEVYNNTVVNNESWASGGSGITMLWEAEGDIANNIVAYNKGGPGIYVGPYEPNGNPQFYNNLLWENEGGNYGGIIPDLTDVNGNIAADPCFIELGYWSDNSTPADINDDFWVTGNYKLPYYYSPARDAGTSINAPEDDIDLNERPHFEGIDIGAYELQVYDITATGTVDMTDMNLLADYWLMELDNMPPDVDDSNRVDFEDYALISEGFMR